MMATDGSSPQTGPLFDRGFSARAVMFDALRDRLVSE
jgi:hypothetical protein